MKITEKLKEVLNEEDLSFFKEEIKKTVNEEAQKIADLVVEERINKIEEIAEEFVGKRVEEEKDKLMEEYDEKINELEEKVVDTLDKFLNSEISEKISDDLIEREATFDVLSPVVEGIKKVFSENHVELDVEGEELAKKYADRVEKLEKDLSEAIAEKMEANENLEKIAIKKLLDEKTEGLSEEQVVYIKEVFDGKPFEKVYEEIDGMVDFVVNKENEVNEDEDEKDDQLVNEDDQIKSEKKKVNEDSDSFYKRIAAKYL